MTTNRDWWAGLTDEQRTLIKSQAAQVSVDATIAYTDADSVALSQLDEHGVELIEPSDEMNADKDAFVAEDLPVIVTNAESAYGVTDAQAKVDKLQALIDKWAGIVEETGGDRDAMIARLNTDVFDKLPTDYGMN
jgi:TRAP-type mannitol/chloroaromatic compound transport system substrate-binding protein